MSTDVLLDLEFSIQIECLAAFNRHYYYIETGAFTVWHIQYFEWLSIYPKIVKRKAFNWEIIDTLNIVDTRYLDGKIVSHTPNKLTNQFIETSILGIHNIYVATTFLSNVFMQHITKRGISRIISIFALAYSILVTVHLLFHHQFYIIRRKAFCISLVVNGSESHKCVCVCMWMRMWICRIY